MSEDDTIPAAEALRQAILSALGEISGRLAAEPRTAVDVHLARRAAKRARALARLAPPDLATLARNTRDSVDNARRALGAARDADVRAATLDILKPRLGAAHETLARLAAGAETAATPAVDIQPLREDIAALIRDWRLCETDGGFDDIIAAARLAYRRMRKRAKAARHGDSAALHRWRSAVVDYEYDADFLSGFAPAMKQARREADRLRKHLGEINDLDELAAYVGKRDAKDARAEIEQLERISATRRAQLVKRAFARADKLLALKPAHWEKEIRRSCAR